MRKCPITRGPCCPLILERLSKMNRGPRIEIGGAYTFLDKRKIWQLKNGCRGRKEPSELLLRKAQWILEYWSKYPDCMGGG